MYISTFITQYLGRTKDDTSTFYGVDQDAGMSGSRADIAHGCDGRQKTVSSGMSLIKVMLKYLVYCFRHIMHCFFDVSTLLFYLTFLNCSGLWP